MQCLLLGHSGDHLSRTVQGIVGETYNRMLVGDAVNDPNSRYYLPDDYTFHGKGPEETYLVDGYFGETSDSLFAKVLLLLLCSAVLLEGNLWSGIRLAWVQCQCWGQLCLDSTVAAAMLAVSKHMHVIKR